MSKSTFDKTKKRVSKMLKIYNKVLSREITNRADRELYTVTNNPSKYTIEFDQLKRDFPDTFRIYLKEILISYESLREFDLEGKQLLLAGNKEIVLLDCFTLCLDVIIEHLKELLIPESEIQEQPQKFEKLKPGEKILIIHYLKIESLKPCQLGLKPGVFFLSRLLDINPDSIKNPISNLDDYTTNPLTKGQAGAICRTLEKVKSFFDNSDLNEISKIIEIRINELKRILGKD
jgi:hypothetical protein